MSASPAVGSNREKDAGRRKRRTIPFYHGLHWAVGAKKTKIFLLLFTVTTDGFRVVKGTSLRRTAERARRNSFFCFTHPDPRSTRFR